MAKANGQRRPLLLTIIVVLIFVGVFLGLIIEPATKSGTWYYLKWFGRTIYVLMLLGFAIVGIGLWKLKEWARQAALGLFSLAILIDLVIIKRAIVRYGQAKSMYTTWTTWGPGYEPITHREFSGLPYLIKHGAAIFSGIVEVIILALVIYYLTRPAVRAVFSGGKIKVRDFIEKAKRAKEAFTKKK